MKIICKPPLLMQFYRQFLNCLPVSSGLTVLSFNRVTNKQFTYCNGLLKATLLNKISITVEPNDHDGRVLYLFGTNDPKVHNVCQALLRPGDVFLDIGANYSSIGLLAIDSVGIGGQIHLFEPQPHICEYVENAIRENGLNNVYLHKVALMDHDGEMRLSRPKNHSGMATLVGRSNQEDWDHVSVPVKNVSTYVPPIIGSTPFGAKLDVEGAEPFIMPWLLKQPNLQFLVFEAAHNHQELWDLVKTSGLVLYGLRRQIFRKQISRVDIFRDLRLYHDLVAIRIPVSVAAPERIDPRRLGQMLENELVRRNDS